QVLSAFSSNSISYVHVPQQSNALNFYLLNNFQILDPGQSSAPLIAYVLDAQNHPVFNVPTTFSNDNATNPVQIATPTSVTPLNGLVQTTVTAPTTPGIYLV